MNNIKDELDNLIKIYNQTNKIILTGNKDVDYEILLNLNIHDITALCLVNKYTQKLCTDNNFWVQKFENDKLPLIYYQDTPAEWTLLYKETLKAKKKAEYSIIINDIELKNDDDNRIIITADDAILSHIIYGQLNHNHEYNIVSIIITKEGDQYDITLYSIDSPLSLILDKNQTIMLLTSCYVYEHELEIMSNDLPLIITNNMYDRYIRDSHKILYKRQGILETLEYLKK